MVAVLCVFQSQVFVFVFNLFAIILEETKTILILLKVTHVEKL